MIHLRCFLWGLQVSGILGIQMRLNLVMRLLVSASTWALTLACVHMKEYCCHGCIWSLGPVSMLLRIGYAGLQPAGK